MITLSTESTNQAETATSQVYCLSFKYNSTCFGHPYAHHHARPARPRATARLPPRSDGKPEAATPDDGHEDAQNMLSCI
jgi:hypothetical protein